MEAFECTIGTEKRDAVNRTSHKKRWVRPWLIGTVSALCAKQQYRSKEEWKAVYFESGAERSRLIARLTEEEQCIARSPKCPENVWMTHPHIAALNFNYGRTLKEVLEYGELLFGDLMKDKAPVKVTKVEMRYLMQYFIIGEAWNDLQLRKQNAAMQLRTFLQDQALSIEVSELDGETAASYAVDSELYVDGVLKCAIQIKPLDFKQSFIMTEEVKKRNQEKNETYTSENAVPVLCVLSKLDGTCFNPEIMGDITKACRRKEVS